LAEALASNWKASSTRSRSEKAAEQALMDAELDLARTLRLSLLQARLFTRSINH
jgi:hypothetical protein